MASSDTSESGTGPSRPWLTDAPISKCWEQLNLPSVGSKTDLLIQQLDVVESILPLDQLKLNLRS